MGISVEIRFAKEKDCVILETISKESLHDSWSEKGFLEALLNPSVRVLVADCESGTIGFCVFSVAADEAEIQSIAVDNAHRRTGVGAELFKSCIGFSAKEGAKSLFLDVRAQNTPARSFYENMGMEIIALRKNFYDNPPDEGVIYRLEIKDA